MASFGTPEKSALGSSLTVKTESPFKRPQAAPKPPPPSTPRATGVPPSTVISSSWLAPYEQRRLFFSILALIEVSKIWDILTPYLGSGVESSWTSSLRVSEWGSALGWTAFETLLFVGVSTLRIPMLSPSGKQILQISVLLIVWNALCWFVAEPGSFFTSIHLIGPLALGGEWYWSWWYAIKRWTEPSHLEGKHLIRLRPYSTATLNPLSLTYCIPPDSPQPLYVPIVFNNSVPDEISYYLKSLQDGSSHTLTVTGSSLKRSTSHKPRLQISNGAGDDNDDEEDPIVDPLSAVVLRAKSSNELSKLPSIRPSDSLSLVPPDIESTQSVLYLSVDKPGIIRLQSARDREGDKFHITPHKEAVIVECPAGTESDKSGSLIKIGKGKAPPPEQRCVGEEEVAHFEARGAGTLKAHWRKRSANGETSNGVMEGIQDESELDPALGDVPRDRISTKHSVPVRVVHDRPGQYTVALTSVTDSLHNTFTPSGQAYEKVYNVLPRPSAKFSCGQGRELLQGQTTALPVVLSGVGDEKLELLYSFKPTGGFSEETLKKDITRNSEVITVSEPGTYTLQDIKGPCPGQIMEPSICQVRLIPPPSVELSVTTLHECAMDVGVTVDFELTGTPPFIVQYTEKRNSARPITRSARISGYSGQVVLQPEQEGQYTYNFVSLSDAKYQQVQLDKPAIEQTVHPLANVELLGSRRRKMYACSGDKVELEFDAKGANPLSLTFLENWSGQTKNTTWHIPPGKQKLFLTLPEELREESGGSGKYLVTLFSIADGNGCTRKVSNMVLEVDIDRQRPTARFGNTDKLIITEGESVKVPLRLTGTAPWSVRYDVDGKSAKRLSLQDPNSNLVFNQKGKHRLIEVKDAHCGGNIVESADFIEIDFKPRPTFAFPLSSPSITDVTGKGNLWRHRDTCAGQEEDIAIRFSGEAPFELGYRYTADGKTVRKTLKSAQSNGLLQLSADPGHHRYDFLEAKDLNYPSSKLSLTLEHEVHGRPSASFTKSNSRPMCLDGVLVGDAKVKLQGKAPFTLEMGVRRPASSKIQSFEVKVASTEWTLDLPYEVRDAGRHEISIVSVKDASGCEQEIKDADVRSTTVDVVESARIVPVTQIEDLCVGDTLDFLLQGKAPWTIEYEWLKKKHKITSSSSRFSRYAEKEGTFKVSSVALKDNQCKREIVNLERRVHPLPSVKIQDGIAHLREGDEPAAFTVRFTGTPPFSFTYTRSEVFGSKSRIVETQTVGDIYEKEYTISSTSPGDYEVVSVSDKFCRYPRITRDN